MYSALSQPVSSHHQEGNTAQICIYIKKDDLAAQSFLSSLYQVSVRSCREGGEIPVQHHDREEPRSDPRQEVSPQNIQVPTLGRGGVTCVTLTSGNHSVEFTMLNFSHRQCCTGKELVDWLMKQNDCLQSRSQAVGMWQVLVDEGILVHGKKLNTWNNHYNHESFWICYRSSHLEQTIHETTWHQTMN